MSRYIWCEGCVEKHGRVEEPHTILLGMVARLGVVCDLCNKPLNVTSRAGAVSFYDGPDDYVPWEHEYFATLEGYEPRQKERPSCGPTHGEADGQSDGHLGIINLATLNETPPFSITFKCREAIDDCILEEMREVAEEAGFPDDGDAIDVTRIADEAGFVLPVAITYAAWAECVRVPPGVEGQDVQGRLWDVLWMLRMGIRGHDSGCLSEVFYQLHVRKDNRDEEPPLVELKAVCGPDDEGCPRVTVMLPVEY